MRGLSSLVINSLKLKRTVFLILELYTDNSIIWLEKEKREVEKKENNC